MGGHVLESWKEEMIRIGREEENARIHAEQFQKLKEKVQVKIGKGKTAAQIAEELEEDIAVILPIIDELINAG